MAYDTLPDEVTISQTVEALQKHGIQAIVVEKGEEAKQKVLELLPEGSEVMTMTSITLDTIGVTEEVNNSGKYNAVKTKLMKMDRNTQGNEMQKLGAAPEWALGSVHAVTHDGKVVIASRTGSQLPAYAYGASHVIWVVGTQKVVKDLDDAMKRIYEYVLPLESERAHKAYGVPASSVDKMLIVNNELMPNRITMILVKEKLGF